MSTAAASAVSLVQAEALERRRALHRNADKSTVKGSLHKSSSHGVRRSLLPPLPHNVLEQSQSPTGVTPRHAKSATSISLPPTPRHSSPRVEAARERRQPQAPAPIESDGSGVGSCGGSFCHFPALAPPNSARHHHAYTAAPAPGEICGAEAVSGRPAVGAADMASVSACVGNSSEKGAATAACVGAPAYAPCGSLSPGRTPTLYGHCSAAKSVGEAGALYGSRVDPVVEKMLKQFGSYVRAFQKEHGIADENTDDLSPRALLEFERENLLGNMAMEEADAREAAEKRRISLQDARANALVLKGAYDALGSEWSSYTGTDDRKMILYMRRLEKRCANLIRHQAIALKQQYSMTRATLRLDASAGALAAMRERLEHEFSEDAISAAAEVVEREAGPIPDGSSTLLEGEVLCTISSHAAVPC